jgi:hypothetical protein
LASIGLVAMLKLPSLAAFTAWFGALWAGVLIDFNMEVHMTLHVTFMCVVGYAAARA